MRDLAYISLLALAMAACNKDTGGDDTDTSGDDTADTGPTTTLSLEDGTTAYSVKVDSVAVCTSTYSMTGEEYTNGFCDNCDFMFSVTTAEATNSDTTGCPNRDPWRFTLSTPYPAAYPDDKAGIGYVAGQWYAVGYDYQPFSKMFFSFYHTDDNVYGSAVLSGIYDDGTNPAITLPGTFTNTDGDIVWAYNPDSTFSPAGAFLRNCSDRADQADGNSLVGFTNGPPGPAVAGGTGPDLTIGMSPTTTLGAVECDNGQYADSYTIDHSAAGDLIVTVDTTDGAHPMDGYMWINDSNGCTVAISDDAFQCASGQCVSGDTDTSTNYDCCPSVKMTGAAIGTYTVYVMGHPQGTQACTDAGHVGNYALKTVGGTVAVGSDELHPAYELDASGTGTIITTTN